MYTILIKVSVNCIVCIAFPSVLLDFGREERTSLTRWHCSSVAVMLSRMRHRNRRCFADVTRLSHLALDRIRVVGCDVGR